MQFIIVCVTVNYTLILSRFDESPKERKKLFISLYERNKLFISIIVHVLLIIPKHKNITTINSESD